MHVAYHAALALRECDLNRTTSNAQVLNHLFLGHNFVKVASGNQVLCCRHFCACQFAVYQTCYIHFYICTHGLLGASNTKEVISSTWKSLIFGSHRVLGESDWGVIDKQSHDPGHRLGLATREYPVTTDYASCFDASQLSINMCPLTHFIEAAILPERCIRL